MFLKTAQAHIMQCKFAARRMGLVYRCTYFCIVLIDVLVVGHFHQTMAEVVVGEDEKTGFQVAVDFLQILEKIVKNGNITFTS